MPPKDVIIGHTACRQINMISPKAWSVYNNCCWTCYLIRLHWPRMKQSFCGLHIRFHTALTPSVAAVSALGVQERDMRGSGHVWIPQKGCVYKFFSMWTCYTRSVREQVMVVDVALPSGPPLLSPFRSPNSDHVYWEIMWISLSARRSQLRRNLTLCILPRSPPSARPNGVTRVQICLWDCEHLNKETMQSSDLWKLSRERERRS